MNQKHKINFTFANKFNFNTFYIHFTTNNNFISHGIELYNYLCACASTFRTIFFLIQSFHLLII